MVFVWSLLNNVQDGPLPLLLLLLRAPKSGPELCICVRSWVSGLPTFLRPRLGSRCRRRYLSPPLLASAHPHSRVSLLPNISPSPFPSNFQISGGRERKWLVTSQVSAAEQTRRVDKETPGRPYGLSLGWTSQLSDVCSHNKMVAEP